MERDMRRGMRLSVCARRLLTSALVCTGATWLAAGVAQAAPTPGSPPPTISGTAVEGSVLTADPGTWSGDAPITFTYAWSDGQSGQSIALTSADVTQSLTVTVTATDDTGSSPGVTSAATDTVAAFTNQTAPALSGASATPRQGDTLSVSTGTWNATPTAVSYQWKDCTDSTATSCTTIAGATTSPYTLQASDVDSTVVAFVTAANGAVQNTAHSDGAGPVLPLAPVDSTAPAITGVAQQGNTLHVTTGTWDNNPTGFTYAWLDCPDGSGTNCSPVSGGTPSSANYTIQASDVGSYIGVKVTASNKGGDGSVTTVSTTQALPPAPSVVHAPKISGTAEQGQTLSVSAGDWNNARTFGYAWFDCSSSACVTIPGATATSYQLSQADVGSTIECVVTATGPGGRTRSVTAQTAVVTPSPIPASSQPTTTALLATPSTLVTNQGVTLIATVTAGASSTALWGTVTFANRGAAIGGCANLPVVPSGQSATVACSTSFPASTAGLIATFTPTPGSILMGSASPLGSLGVGRDTSSTSLDASASVDVGSSTTYTATVTPPAARPGPVLPTGSVEFLDAGQPIGSCANQRLVNGAATCTLSYNAAGAHQITAVYSGDGNFTGSTSPAQSVSAVTVPASVLGTITSTMQWVFYYTPRKTVVRALVVNGVAPGATVIVNCHGHGCPFASRSTLLVAAARCAKHPGRMCLRAGSFNVTPAFAGRPLAIGARITIRVVQANWIGKSYSFTIRPGHGPRVQIGCLAPGGTQPGVGC